MKKLTKHQWCSAAKVLGNWTEEEAADWRNARKLASCWDGLEPVIQEYWSEWIGLRYGRLLKSTWYYNGLATKLGRKLLVEFFTEMEAQAED